MSDPIGIGVIGCGIIAATAHLPAWQRLRHRARIVAVADVREEVARQTAREFGAESWVTDYRYLLDRPDIHVIDVCTPEFLHAEQVVAALAAGKHVVCEKPMAATLSEADSMIAAAERAGVRFMVGHTRRFTPRYVALKKHVDEGAVGQVRLVREIERRPRAMWSVRDRETWKPDGQRPWGVDPRYSRGIALGSSIHELDLFQWFMADRPSRVYARTRITRPGGQLPDHIVFSVRFQNGGLAYSDQSANQPSDYPFYHEMEIYGTEGLLRANDPESVTFAIHRGGGLRASGTFVYVVVRPGWLRQPDASLSGLC